MRKLISPRILSVIFAFFLLNGVIAQPAARVRIISPEVHPDKSVTFRFLAPNSGKVVLSCQFLNEDKPMTKNESGVWSYTSSPVKPDIYPYYFIVDGIQVADPNNPEIFANDFFKNSLVDIPGDTPLIHSIQDVPHGNLTYINYKSKAFNSYRPLVIYTPPGYEKNTNVKYPVLYLIHGSTDTEETWTKVGKAHLIMDNLIAQGKAKPMIIVMPYATTDTPAPTVAPANGPRVVDQFEEDMLNTIIPYTENNYRVLTDSKNRAITGFSRGGRQTLSIGLANSDKFAYVCGFAPSVRNMTGNFEQNYASAETLNKNLKLFWISVGNADSLCEPDKEFMKVLDEKNIKYKSLITEGGHTWMNCKLFLTLTAPMLFN